jgi:predicted GNAT family N-acyltransferase
MIQVEIVDWFERRLDLVSVRTIVFVEEQKVPLEMECDEWDSVSTHWLATDGEGKPIGTARLLPKGRIGRVAVLKELRRSGVGHLLMSAILDEASKRGLLELQLHAQLHSIPFYEKSGFTPVGDRFEEAGITHVEMYLILENEKKRPRL